jgi:uncharacterized delta-60 repeat protein
MRLVQVTLHTAQTIAVASALVLVSAAPVAAAPGQLDMSFGASGTVVTEFPASYSGARAVALLPGGGMVAAGFAHANDSVISDFALAQYDAGGALDTAFGIGGRVRTDFGGRYDDALAVFVQPNGKIVVAGTSADSSGSDMAVARYNRNGTPDTSFDGDGMALVDFGNESSARAVALQRDGKLVLAGWALHTDGTSCCSSDFALVRLTGSGAMDSSFGDRGRVLTDFLPGTDNGYDAAFAVAVQPDGRIVAAGAGVSGGASVDFAISRYRDDGSLDPTFSRDGRAVSDFAGYPDEIRALAIDARGRVVAGGQVCGFPGNSDEVCDFGLARYTQRGVLDEHFGHHGKVRTDLGADVSEGIRGVVVQRDGRIVAAGETRGAGGEDVGLVRYRAGGRLDRSFGSDGIVTTPVSSSTDEVGGLKLEADGRLVVAGTAAISQSFGFFVSRYLGG